MSNFILSSRVGLIAVPDNYDVYGIQKLFLESSYFRYQCYSGW